MDRVGPWPCTWLLPSANATLRLLREAEKRASLSKSLADAAGQLRCDPWVARGRNTSTCGRSFARLAEHADPRCLGQWKFTAFVLIEWQAARTCLTKDSRDKLAMNTLEQ